MRDLLAAFLRRHRVVTVAVIEAGEPHAAALFYASDDELNLYVLTDPRTRHGRAMASAGVVAGTIQRDRQRWATIQGVQFRGRCTVLHGAARREAWRVFTARFPWLARPRGRALLTLAPRLARVRLWRITPDQIRLVDNRREFGAKKDWRRPLAL